MKHKIACSLLAAGMIIPTLAISGCKCEKELKFKNTMFVNQGEGKFTQDYLNKHNLDESKSIGYTHTNLTTYEDIIKNNEIPTEEQIIPPEGKSFAGWFFNNEYAKGDNVNKERIESIIYNDKNDSSFSIFPKWIDKGNNVFYVHIDNKEIEYSESYKAKYHSDIINRIITFEMLDSELTSENIKEKLNTLATIDDFVTVDYKYKFSGWYLDETYTIPATVDNILSRHNQKNISCFNFHAKWEEYPTNTIIYSRDVLDLYPDQRVIDPENENRKYTYFAYKDNNMFGHVFALEPCKYFNMNATIEEILANAPKEKDFADDLTYTNPIKVEDYELVWYIDIQESKYDIVQKDRVQMNWQYDKKHYYIKDEKNNYIKLNEDAKYDENQDYYAYYNHTYVRCTPENLAKAKKFATYISKDNTYLIQLGSRWYKKA